MSGLLSNDPGNDRVEMTDAQRAKWEAIEGFELDDPASALSFTGRLARDNGWSRRFATAVVDEYRRFLFLAVEAGHPVTPSEEVDQAWHLHLAYTRSYWDDLCGTVLGQPLHHGPTRGGDAEDTKFTDWYARTLASYERFFGHPPPADVWPPSTIRFGEAASYQRVNRARNWVIPKPSVASRKAVPVGAAFAMLATGCTAVAGPGYMLAMAGEAIFLIIVGAVLVLLLALGRRSGARLTGGGRRQPGTGCGVFHGWDSSGDGGGSDDGGGSGCGGGGCGGGGGGCGGGGCGS